MAKPLRSCPHCRALLDPDEATCSYCGYQLEAPRARLTLFKAKGEKVATVLVGAPTPDGKGCYLQLEGKPEVLIASQDYARRWEELLKPLWPGASPSPSASPSP